MAAVYHNLGGLEHARGRFTAGEPYARWMETGFEDWRLPTNRELFSIINHNNPNPALDHRGCQRGNPFAG